MERIQSQVNVAKKGWVSVQGKTLKKQYSSEKAKDIIEKGIASGMYYDCDLFPNDEDDTCPLDKTKRCFKHLKTFSYRPHWIKKFGFSIVSRFATSLGQILLKFLFLTFSFHNCLFWKPTTPQGTLVLHTRLHFLHPK